MKQFAIGLSPLSYYDNDLSKFQKFCHKNKYRIKHWYTSPPWTWWTKKISYASYKKERKGYIEQLKILNKENQDLQLCVNIDLKSKILTFLFSLTLVWYKIRFERYKKVDSIVCRDEYIPYLRKIFPKATLTYSVQNDFVKTKLKNLKYCDTIVIGRRYIKNLNFIKKVKQEYNLKIELLLNCACNFICTYDCFNGSCETSQQRLIQSKGLDWCIAWQSLIPSELNLYPQGLIDYYKISSRPSSLDWLESEMDLYDSDKHLSELHYRYDRPDFWRLVCCTNSISQAILNGNPNLNNILEIKSKIWTKLLGREIHVY